MKTGIAMGNADPRVKAVAAGVTGGPDDHGISTGSHALGLV